MTLQAYDKPTDAPRFQVVSLPEAIYTLSTIRELKAEGKAIGIRNYSRMTKATLITRLTAKTLWDEENHEL